MNKIITSTIIATILVIGITVIYFSQRVEYNGQNETDIIIYNEIGLANPSSGYCSALGYKSRKGSGEHGGEIVFCIFPDNSECEQWAFYRGKCGQEWSYCKLEGYNLKNLSQNEGWGLDGSICINRDTEEEIGNVFDLVNQIWVAKQKQK